MPPSVGTDAQSPVQMSEPEATANPEASGGADRPVQRIFLVVVDESPEMAVALRFACRRARHSGGRVALLYVIEPSEFQNWLGVGKLINEEARQAAEQVLQRQAARASELTGSVPILYLREGSKRDELLALIEEEPSISILVLGAKTDPGGPGPLVSALTGKFVGRLRVPVTLVPGGLSDEDVDALS